MREGRAGVGLDRVLWLLPIVIPLMFIVAVSANFALLGIDRAASLEALDRHVAAVSNARTLFVVAAAAFAAAMVGSIGYSAFVLLRVRYSLREAAALLAWAVAWLAVAWHLDFGRILGGEYGDALLATVIERVPQGRLYVDVLQALLVSRGVGLASLGLAVCSVVHPSRARNARTMAVSARDFYHLLYLTTGVLLTGMMLTYCILHWAALLADPAKRTASAMLGDGILFSVGIFYSVMMVVVFVPTAIMQMRLIEGLERGACQATPGVNLEQWRTENGLQFSPLTAARTYVAMATPLPGGAVQFLASRY